MKLRKEDEIMPIIRVLKNGKWQGVIRYIVDENVFEKYIYASTEEECHKKICEFIDKQKNKEA